MNALPPSGSPAACVRGAERRSPRPIGPCAGTAAKSVARPSAQDAPGPRRPAFFTAAGDPERCREFARDRSRRRDRARRDARTCTRCGAHPPIEGGTVCEPCHVARRDRRSTAKRSRKKAKNARSRQRYARRRARRLCSDCGAPSQGASRCRIEKRPPRLNLLAHPYLPRAEVATTSARSYMGLLKGAAP